MTRRYVACVKVSICIYTKIVRKNRHFCVPVETSGMLTVSVLATLVKRGL